jgi:hypothetical protein
MTQGAANASPVFMEGPGTYVLLSNNARIELNKADDIHVQHFKWTRFGLTAAFD